MIETVQERQRGAYNFESHYDNLCALQDSCPLPTVKAHLADGILDLNGDRIRQQDWNPIFNSIKINKNLRFMAIRSYFHLNLDDALPEKKAKILRSRIPVIRSKELTSNLCKSIRDCLSSTEQLECLEIQGIPLSETDVVMLGQGLMKNNTLRHLSFESCRISDCGLTVLCGSLKLAGNVSTLNLSGCNISPRGLTSLADLIKFQAMSRHNEAWKESLRYRWANFDSMCGIRRMTLNNNFAIGDEGAELLADSLKDDLWVKAIDMQECSLSNTAVRSFLKVLKYNSTLVVLDLRLNPKIEKDLLRSVTEQVLINGNGKETEYKWLRVEDIMRSKDENYERHPRTYYNGPSKPLNPRSRPVFKPAGQLRSKSASSLDRKSRLQLVTGYSDDDQSSSKMSSRINSARGSSVHGNSKGQPWRTAARATRVKGYPPEHVPGKSSLEEHYDNVNDDINVESSRVLHKSVDRLPTQTQTHISNTARHDTSHVSRKPIHNTHNNIHKNTPTKSKQKSKTSSREAPFVNNATVREPDRSSVVSPLLNTANKHPPIPESTKQLKSEIFQLRNQLDKYKMEKKKINEKFNEILCENKRLRNTISLMTKTNEAIAERQRANSILEDEMIIDAIENSFEQFHAFLDMLRQSGLEKVVSAAGMDEFTSTKKFMEKLGRQSKREVTNGGYTLKEESTNGNEIGEEEEEEEEEEVNDAKDIEIKDDKSNSGFRFRDKYKSDNDSDDTVNDVGDSTKNVTTLNFGNMKSKDNLRHSANLSLKNMKDADVRDDFDNNSETLAHMGWKENDGPTKMSRTLQASVTPPNAASGDILNGTHENNINDPYQSGTTLDLLDDHNLLKSTSKSNKFDKVSKSSEYRSDNSLSPVKLPGYRYYGDNNSNNEEISHLDKSNDDNNYNYTSSTSSIATSSHVTKATTNYGNSKKLMDNIEVAEMGSSMMTNSHKKDTNMFYNQQASIDAAEDVDLDNSYENNDL